MAQVLALPKAHGIFVRKPHQKHLSKGKNPVSDIIIRLKCEIILLTFLDNKFSAKGGLGVVWFPNPLAAVRWGPCLGGGTPFGGKYALKSALLLPSVHFRLA